ncbi:MAG: GspH/FimT family pseudopilin [Nitrobacter sp.]
MNRLKQSSAGFTLAEMLVVIGIIALVIAATVSARPKASATRVAVATRAVTATLQLARAQAMVSNVETVFRLDVDKGRFGLPNSMHALPRGMAAALTIAETERAGRSGGIRFYPDGQSSGGEIALMLDGRTARIAVNWLTGEPRLMR